MIQKIYLKRIFTFLGMIGVIFGAFGAHALKTMTTPALLESWKTATLYLFIHVLAGLYALNHASSRKSILCFLFGIFIFSGSLYTLVLTGNRFFGMITPIGGVLFIVGWLLLSIERNHNKI